MEVTKDVLIDELHQIEKTEHVKIIYACESGSRAWGFASSDSDYDVRFIYVRPPGYYLSLSTTRDVIEWKLDDVLDINGWDIKKALELLYRGNPALYEWLHSPIQYIKNDDYEDLTDLLNKYFQIKKLLYHYVSMAKKTYRSNVQGKDKVIFKKYFYVLRPLFAAQWIIRYQEIPPIEFDALRHDMADEDINGIIDRLLVLKQTVDEKYCIAADGRLNDYIEQSIAEVSDVIETFETKKHSIDHLDDYFYKIVMKYNGTIEAE